MRFVKSIFHKISYLLAKRSNEAMRNYYRRQGCIIGDKTRFTGAMLLGSEPYLIEIGEDCLITGCSFYTHDGGVKVLNSLSFFGEKKMDKMGRIRIGNNCFIGKDAKIMDGVIIGDNCIIGAGSIVARSIPPNSVAAGVPAKVICTIEEYYKKNLEKGKLYHTEGMNAFEKKTFLLKNVKEL